MPQETVPAYDEPVDGADPDPDGLLDGLETTAVQKKTDGGNRRLVVVAALVALAVAMIATGFLVQGDENDPAQPTGAPISGEGSEVPLDPGDPLVAFGTDALVAYVAREEGDETGEIYVARPDGSEVRQITEDSAADIHPAWSPDGNELVFSSDRGQDPEHFSLFIVDVETLEVRRLTDGPRDFDPDWSLDGDSVVFGRDTVDSSQRDLFVVDVENGDVVSLPSTDGEDRRPVWVPPDGQSVAFASDVDGQNDLFTTALDAEPELLVGSPDVDEFHASFSPDGALLAYGDQGRLEVLQNGVDPIDLPSLARELGLGSVDFSPSGRSMAATLFRPDDTSTIITFSLDPESTVSFRFGTAASDPAWFRPG